VAARGQASDARATARRRATRNADTGITLTSPERIVYADAGYTKADVFAYYRAVAPLVLADVADRPLSLLRCPGGAGASCFFQKNHDARLGAHVGTVSLVEKDGEHAEYIRIDDAAGLLELVQMNALEFHPWGARVDDVERPDRVIFDLDPGPGVAWAAVVAAARDVRAALRASKLESFVRLSGGKGIHVVAPIRRGPGWDAVKAFCERIADGLAESSPQRYVATASKALRDGRIFIDWLRNARGATSVASWSLRARPSAGVAIPLRWDELARAGRGDAFDLRRAQRRAASMTRDPWDGYARLRQDLPRANTR
jgi:bifunctional non-homologous end joining protein LigD